MKFLYTLSFILFLNTCHVLRAQLVNIESKRMVTDSTQFLFKGDLLFNYTDNNGVFLLKIGTNVSTQYKSKDFRKTYFMIANYNLIRTDDKEVENSWFFHTRYNQKLATGLWFELFLQNQNNQQLTITRRNLVGTGIRFQLISKKRTNAYIGNSYMYEIEEIKTTGQKFYNHRNSTYFSFNQSIQKPNIDFSGTIYFQPLYKDIGNHRILSQLKAEVPFSKTLSLSAMYDYFFTNFSSQLTDDRSSIVSVGITFTL